MGVGGREGEGGMGVRDVFLWVPAPADAKV